MPRRKKKPATRAQKREAVLRATIAEQHAALVDLTKAFRNFAEIVAQETLAKRGTDPEVQVENDQIRAMRAAGMTWPAIGAALDIEPDAARKRWERYQE
jgi:hypothetical protein